ncbi:SPOR domain-containing protein [Halomonas sp. PR-M31]|uniref:SPOR domain-containing protein n=1 Tax=Halomonas sp. PR-M31 TaxID=1471202 RepID=UPI000650E31B|nr:SPOR domain-containing protein [Halomonas sp. PR-M31]
MKYGMRERISGAVILLALAVIFIPMLFDDPPSRETQPEPTLTLEKPIDVERKDVAEPEPPASLGQIQTPQMRGDTPRSFDESSSVDRVEPEEVQRARQQASQQKPTQQIAKPDTRSDPIAELARRNQERANAQESEKNRPQESAQQETPKATQGDWAVQAGSFGEPDNAKSFQADLETKGFNAFSRTRDNDLTTVYVGPYTSSEAGEKARTELKQKANIQGLLIRLRGQE